MTKEEAIQEQIDDIMDEFEFHKAQKIMDFLEWKWFFNGENSRVPSISDIRRAARKLLKAAAITDRSQSSGGLTASCQSGFDENEKRPWIWLGLYFGLDYSNEGTCYDP